MPTLATFSVNNFFLRYRFANTHPGDMSKKSAIDAAGATLGVRTREKVRQALSKDFVIWDPVKRNLAAQLLCEPDGTLRRFYCKGLFDYGERRHGFRELCAHGLPQL